MKLFTEKLKAYKVRCRKYRRFRVLFAFIAVLTVFNFGASIFNSVMNLISKTDRATLHEAQREVQTDERLIIKLQTEAAERERINQVTLAAQKEIQATVIYALDRKGVWSAEDKIKIARNWDDSQYMGLENPFPEYEKK